MGFLIFVVFRKSETYITHTYIAKSSFPSFSHATMNDNSSEEKNAIVLSEEVRQKIMGGLKAFLRGREVDLNELDKDLRIQYDKQSYQVGQTVLEATRALQDFDKLRRRNLTGQEQRIVYLILRLCPCSKPMAKFIARSTYLMDQLGISSFFFQFAAIL